MTIIIVRIMVVMVLMIAEFCGIVVVLYVDKINQSTNSQHFGRDVVDLLDISTPTQPSKTSRGNLNTW